MIRFEQSMAFLVPAAGLVPLGVIYLFGNSATGFGWALFGAILLVMVERTVRRMNGAHLASVDQRFDKHLALVTSIMERTALTADSVDTTHKAAKARMDRFEGSLERVKEELKLIDQRCASIQDR